MGIDVAKWTDNILKSQSLKNIVGLCFILRELGGHHYSLEIIGTSDFNSTDSSWRYNEITDFGTKENPLLFYSDKWWNPILWDFEAILVEYAEGYGADKLKTRRGVALGFDDGDLRCLYENGIRFDRMQKIHDKKLDYIRRKTQHGEPQELSIGEKRKIFRREFKTFNQENDFRFITPNVLLREKNGILQYIYFKIKAGILSGEIAAQPLYLPDDSLNLTISLEIQYLSKKSRRNWGYWYRTEEEFTEDVREIVQIISTGGMKWWGKTESPEKLIKSTLDFPAFETQGYYPLARMLTVAVSYLRIGNTEKGLEYLEKCLEICKESSVSNPYTQARIKRYQDGIEFIHKYPEEVPKQLDAVIQQTRNNLIPSKKKK